MGTKPMTTFLDRSCLHKENGLAYFQVPEFARLAWVRHAFLTRKGGVSLPPYDSLNIAPHTGDREDCVRENRWRIASAFGFNSDNLILLKQVHRDKALVLKEPIPSLPPLLEYDALITNVPNLVLGIRSADCIPILLLDPRRKTLAAVHAGRKGTGLQIAPKVIKKMGKEFGSSPPDLLAAIGPGIGSCCYEIDEKVFLQAYEPFAIPKGDGRWNLDLFAMNLAQLEAAGVKGENIFRIDLCTQCHHDLFFSYRKEGRTGTQLSFIGKIG
jgi:YfiH family protein